MFLRRLSSALQQSTLFQRPMLTTALANDAVRLRNKSVLPRLAVQQYFNELSTIVDKNEFYAKEIAKKVNNPNYEMTQTLEVILNAKGFLDDKGNFLPDAQHVINSSLVKDAEGRISLQSPADSEVGMSFQHGMSEPTSTPTSRR